MMFGAPVERIRATLAAESLSVPNRFVLCCKCSVALGVALGGAHVACLASAPGLVQMWLISEGTPVLIDAHLRLLILVTLHSLLSVPLRCCSPGCVAI
jgi:hypothetical protein